MESLNTKPQPMRSQAEIENDVAALRAVVRGVPDKESYILWRFKNQPGAFEHAQVREIKRDFVGLAQVGGTGSLKWVKLKELNWEPY